MRINRNPHRRSDRSEAQRNPKTCRRAMTNVTAQLLQHMLGVAMVVVVFASAAGTMANAVAPIALAHSNKKDPTASAAGPG